jgi:hypothetical protein
MSEIKSWLKKSNGWQRFWIVVTCIYAVLTLVILTVNITDFESFAVFLMWFVFPVTIFFVTLYILTFSIKWVRKALLERKG